MPKFFLISCATGLLALSAAFAGGSVANPFRQMDADGDGRISRGEHAAAAHERFIAMDANGDGFVTAAEMAALSHPAGPTRGDAHADRQAAETKIRVIDEDGDGRITAAEHEAGSKRRFAWLDTDGDGFLTAAEFYAGHQR